jgi:hypothetical protein
VLMNSSVNTPIYLQVATTSPARVGSGHFIPSVMICAIGDPAIFTECNKIVSDHYRTHIFHFLNIFSYVCLAFPAYIA